MATTTTPRLGLTVWSAGTDAPTRAQFTGNFEALDAAVVRTAGGDTITPAAGVRGLVVRTAAGATANAQEWQDSTATVRAQVQANGEINTSFALSVGALSRPDATTGTYLTTSNSSVRPLVVRAAAGATASIVEFQNSAGTALVSVNANGELFTTDATLGLTRRLFFGATDSAGTGFRTVRVAN